MNNIYPEINGLAFNPCIGLQGLTNANPFTITHMSEQCTAIIGHLDEWVSFTAQQAPKRSRNFCLTEKHSEWPKRLSRNKERLLERALWEHAKQNASTNLFPGFCNSIHSYQVPFKPYHDDSRHLGDNESWGKIDLLGNDSENNPVVIELKCNREASNNSSKGSADNLMRMIIEGVAYAIAVRENWNNIFKEWPGLTSLENIAPKKWKVLGIAPKEYWERLFRKDCSGYVRPHFWPNLWKLLKVLDSGHNILVEFAQFEHSPITDPVLTISCLELITKKLRQRSPIL